jgi:CBS domain-containing protein
MTRKVFTIAADAPIAAAVQLMERHQIKRLPVLLRDRVVGILTRSDLMRAMLDLDPAIEQSNDDIIRTRLLQEIEAQGWSTRGTARISVDDGVVRIEGLVFDSRQRDALRVAAENIPGVRAVHVNMSWIEPVSGFTYPLSEQPNDAV